MRILIVDDDYQSRVLLQKMLEKRGDCQMEEDGKKALGAFVQAISQGDPFGLVCMDIMMPEMDGQEALRRIRAIEKERGLRGKDEAKIIMTTALDDPKNVFEAYYKGGATSYIAKPIDAHSLLHMLRNMELI